MLHIGTNNIVKKTLEVILDKILSFKNVTGKRLLAFQVIISNIMQKPDNGKVSPNGMRLNKHLWDPELDYIDNNNSKSEGRLKQRRIVHGKVNQQYIS